jgi:hypothetical protein
MKRLFCILIILIAPLTIPLTQAATLHAQETLGVASASICRDVVNQQPIGAGQDFEASVGKVFCFTKITGAQGPIEISHVWYYGDIQRATVILPVKSSSWRTYSSKRIQTHEIGDWHVDVLGPTGQVLRTLQFKITP